MREGEVGEQSRAQDVSTHKARLFSCEKGFGFPLGWKYPLGSSDARTLLTHPAHPPESQSPYPVERGGQEGPCRGHSPLLHSVTSQFHSQKVAKLG